MSGGVIRDGQGVLSADEALRFLDEASAVLASSLDYEQTVGHIAQLLVPLLADWCVVDVVTENGPPREITSGHPDPEQERLLAELRRRHREERGGDEGALRVIATGEPELHPDVRGLARARTSIHEDEAALYERLGPRSYLIVPLIARGRTLGAMTLLSTREGRHYGDSDLAFAQHLAGRFALAIDNARLFAEANNARALLDDFFVSAPFGLGFLDRELRYLNVNPALARINGRPVEEHLGRTPTDLLGEAAEPAEQLLRQVLDTGEAVLDLELSAPRPDGGGLGHWLSSYTPVHGREGEVTGVSGVVIDVTDRRRALDAARLAAQRARFMAEAGRVLDASRDHESVLRDLSLLVVGEFADRCVVLLTDEDGTFAEAAAAGDGPVGPELEAAARPDADEAVVVEGQGVVVPLSARGRTLGAVVFARAEPYDEDDIGLLCELGRRAGAAVEHARLYTERSRIAHTLQARLLPSRLPAPPGMQLAARYRAAGQYTEVGGDFYDAFQRSPDEWVVLIGDVSGKGPEAAALTALARYTIRAAALNDWAPAHVLRRLNETLLHEEESQFITVAMAYVRHDGPDTRLRLVLGGHPPPFVVRSDGAIEQVGVPGTLLGIRSDARLHEVEVSLAPDDSLVLFTDGVLEAGPRTRQLGEDGVRRVLAALGGASPEQLVAALDEAARAADTGRARDDVAILALQAGSTERDSQERTLSRPAGAQHLRELREAAVTVAATLPGMDVEAVRLAVGEACGNVVLHAYRRSAVPGEIHLRALVQEDRLIVEVRDDGCGPSPRTDSPGLGLGMPLMARLSRELQVLDREPAGTLVRLTF